MASLLHMSSEGMGGGVIHFLSSDEETAVLYLDTKPYIQLSGAARIL